jgi:tetratricopeptide (TPR) repeat protein
MRISSHLERRLNPAICMAIALLIPSLGCGSRNEVPPVAAVPEVASERLSEKGSDPLAATREGQTPFRIGSESETTATTNVQKTEPLNRDREMEQAEQLLEQGEFAGAILKLKALLVADPNDVEVIFWLANATAASGDLAQAIELLDSIPSDHPEAGIPSLGQSADWCQQLERYQEAEQRYEKILALLPQLAEVHRKLAFLYNCQGRRQEAAVHIAELCKQGNIRQDELHALINLSDPMYDDPSAASSGPGDVRYYPIGPGSEARRLFTAKKYREAMDQLQATVAADDQSPALVALYGRAATEAQDDAQFRWWLSRTNEDTQRFADYWAAIGAYLLLQSRHQEAARALLEAIDRDPTDIRSIGRLRSTLEVLGLPDQAKQCEQRSKLIRDIAIENNRIADSAEPNVQSMEVLAELLDSMGRNAEGVLWRSISAVHRKLPRESMLPLNSRLREVVQSGNGFPSQPVRLCSLNPNNFPLPTLELPKGPDSEPSESVRREMSPHPARFENMANKIGLKHAYQVASQRIDFGFTVYQSMGGAVAVIDYDLDGNPDLYFSQGGTEAPEFIGTQTNELYRNLDTKLADVTEIAMATEYRYSTGLTVGDWNQDGFADIVIANIGANSLLINNGDGTFAHSTLDDRDDKTILTTSLAMADLNGDALPDLFEVNYIYDPRISQPPAKNERGEVIKSLSPLEFQPGLDRWARQDAEGKTTFQNISNADAVARAGLGVVVADFDQQGGNEIFVGNDVYANQLWFRNTDTADPESWSDLAMLRGCAYAFNGAKTASMGVAVGDFDHNGWMDLHVTNFQDENASLYLNSEGFFQDRNVQFGLDGPSYSVLGFGTQALDYENDGKLDLVVTNGHIEKAVTIPAPFEQPAQLFSNLGSRFELIEVADPSGYWSENHLGRGLARLDFNRDGKNDFVITHLGETSALLLNQTETQNHWLQLSLVGVSSERDAIGAKVQIRFGNQQLTEWVVAGDGYLCRNESVVSFGLGEVSAVDQIIIQWPSGQQQTIQSVPADRRLLIVENDPEPFAF